MRLWSTVVSQRVTLPVVHGTRRTCVSALVATRLLPLGLLATAGGVRFRPDLVAALVDPLRDVPEERVDLIVRPVLADRRHRAAALADELLERLPVGEQRVPRDARADEALAVRPVALRARRRPLLGAELGRLALLLLLLLREPRVELLARHHLDGRLHRRVLDAAELGALALVRPDRVRLEPHA